MKKTTAKYEYVLFDLDGTLTDPALGITNSVMYALKKFLPWLGVIAVFLPNIRPAKVNQD